MDTEKMYLDDIEYLLIRIWTTSDVAALRARAVVANEELDNCMSAKDRNQKGGKRHDVFKSSYCDPVTREFETRDYIVRIVHEPRPRIPMDYAGCVWYGW